MFVLVGSTTTELIERPRNALPVKVPFPAVVMGPICAGRGVQVSPPLVDLQRPIPASESPDWLGSPVPAMRSPLALPSSKKVSAPIALVGNPLAPPETYVQVGVAASALVVLQMPPPAAATQTRQKAALQP